MLFNSNLQSSFLNNQVLAYSPITFHLEGRHFIIIIKELLKFLHLDFVSTFGSFEPFIPLIRVSFDKDQRDIRLVLQLFTVKPSIIEAAVVVTIRFTITIYFLHLLILYLSILHYFQPASQH